MQPSLDHWTTAFLLASFLGLFIAPLLWRQAGAHRRQVGYVALIVGLFAVTLAYYVLWWSGYARRFMPVVGVPEVLNFLYGPLFYLYLHDLAGRPADQRARRRHFVPFLVMVGLNLPFILLPVAEKRLLLREAFHGDPGGALALFFTSQPWLFIAQQVLYAVAIWRLRPAFAALPGVARWAGAVAVAYTGFVVSGSGYYILAEQPFFSRLLDYALSGTMTAFILGTVALAYIQPHVFQAGGLPATLPDWLHPASLAEAGASHLPTLTTTVVPALPSASGQPTWPDSAPADAAGAPVPASARQAGAESGEADAARYRHSGLPPALAEHLAQRLDQLMRAECLYRQGNLRLDSLAQRLGLTRHHLSQVLNEQLGLSFFEYINHLRIEEARALLRDPAAPARPVIEVATQVGYNNKVSFNKAFKAATGLTPTEYRQAASTPLTEPGRQAGAGQLIVTADAQRTLPRAA